MLCQGLSLPGYLNVPGPPECARVPEWQGLKNGGAVAAEVVHYFRCICRVIQRPARSQYSSDPNIRSRGLRGFATHLGSSPAQNGANTVFGHANTLADFLVTLTLKMVHPHHIGFLRIEPQHQLLDLFAILDP